MPVLFFESTFNSDFSISQVRGHSESGTLVLDTGGMTTEVNSILVMIDLIIFLGILLSGLWLLRRPQSDNSNSKTYFEKINTFTKNARLYILHIQGMSLTYGIRTVLFNIYLLFVFIDGVNVLGVHLDAITFIGVLLAVGSLVSRLVSMFAGIVVDKIGKKWSFIIGDFVGAVTILVVVLIPNALVVLIMQVVRMGIMSIHNIAEGSFIYEQSTPRERVHLFSVSSGFSTLASVSGNLLGGVVPLAIALLIYHATVVRGALTIFVLQVGLLVSVLMWLGSLLPAFFMKERILVHEASDMALSARLGFKNVKNWSTILIFVINSMIIGFGAGMFIEYFSLFFLLYYEATPAPISMIFAFGAFFIAMGNLISPMIAEKWGKVKAIVSTRLLAIPFMILLPLGPVVASKIGFRH